MQALLGTKVGMTQIINKDGKLVPSTVIVAGPCLVTDLRTVDKHGYKAAQIAFGDLKAKHATNAKKVFFEKKKLALKKHMREIRLDEKENLEIGQEIKVDIFKAGDLVDVQGTSIGKGFAGGMKRWGWKGGPGSHGSMFHRRIGSVGASSFPSRTWPGHHMPGHMGNVTKSVQNLEVLRVDVETNMIVVRGAVPGPDNRLLFIRRSLKNPEGVKIKVGPAVKLKKDPLKASKQAAAGKGGGKK